MKFLLVAPLLAGLLLESMAQAAPLTYVLEGDLQLIQSLDYWQLDGAHFVWTLETDTDWRLPITEGNNPTDAYYGPAATSVMTITNRPVGGYQYNPGPAPDVTTNVKSVDPTANPLMFSTFNYPVGVGRRDFLTIRGGYLEAFDYLDFTGVKIEFPSEYFPGNEAASLPLNFDTAVQKIWDPWDAQPKYAAKYQPINWTITASVVPIPPAVFLFGSALGLMGVMRRKVAVT
ncbi:MAG: hypothetical protein EXR82_10615 [Gammaproteobacteria bacterium]|nr:hypothetical protein [Gammaproteobacteria bacterium]